MRKILEDLYYGNIAPSEKTFLRKSEYARLMEKRDEFEEYLNRMLDGESKSRFQSFVETQSEISDVSIAESFIDGFRLGVKLILAALSEEDGVFRPLV